MVKPFQLVAGNVALDLVNTLDLRFRESGSEDLLKNYDDLLRFVNQAGLTTNKIAPGTEAERMHVLAQVKELRETLARVLYGLLDGKQPGAKDLSILESHFNQAGQSRKLVAKDGHLTWQWPHQANVAAPLWLLAQEAANLLLSDRAELIRSCADDTCAWLFLDTSKNHTRRWCDMKLCGNRVKARNFQARRNAATYPGTETPARSPKSPPPSLPARKHAPAETDRS